MFDFVKDWKKIRLFTLGFSIVFIAAASIFLPQDIALNAHPSPVQGLPAPDFKLQTVEGDWVQLSDFKGQPVILNLWASWCPPCKAEMPSIQNVYEQYHSQGLAVLAVNMTIQDNLEDVNQFISSQQLSFPILLDENGNAESLYQMRALPTTFFIRPDGIIDQVVIGGPIPEGFLIAKAIELIGEMH
jgi:cytochrome c biogenesis protein CcmG/thiol:disulfide interchange protein DsbE